MESLQISRPLLRSNLSAALLPPSSSLFILVDSAPLLPLFPLNCKAESNAITSERSSGRQTSQLITAHMLPNTRSLSASTPSNDLLRFLNARFCLRSARTGRRQTLATVAAERRMQECNYTKTAAHCKTCRHALVCIPSSPPSAIVCLGCCPPVVLMRVFLRPFVVPVTPTWSEHMEEEKHAFCLFVSAQRCCSSLFFLKFDTESGIRDFFFIHDCLQSAGTKVCLNSPLLRSTIK